MHGGTGPDFGESISGHGQYVVMGGEFLSSSITFGAYTLNSANSNADPYVVLYDNDGNVQWVAHGVGAQSDEGKSVAMAADGSVYFAGIINSPTLTFGGTDLQKVTAGSDVFLVKFDPTGNVVWSRVYGTASDPILVEVNMTVDQNGDVYLAGDFQMPVNFGGFNLTTNGGSDAFVTKINASGQVQWAKSIGSNGIEYVRGLCTYNNNVYLTGEFGSSSFSFGGTTYYNSGAHDFFILQYDNNGNEGWAATGGGTGYDRGYDITVTSYGVSILGSFDSNSFNLGGNTISHSGNTTWDDLFVAHYDNLGNIQWTDATGGDDVDNAGGITSDSFGYIYITGAFSTPPTVTFGGTHNLTSTGWADAYIVKYDHDGNVVWAIDEGGVGGGDFFTDLYRATDGSLYFTGVSGSNTFPLGNHVLSLNGFWDVPVGRYNEAFVGINETDGNRFFATYPNPVQDELTIRMEQPATATIYNSLGAEVIQLGTLQQTHQVSMEALPPGIYLVEVMVNEQRYSKKVVKN